ncbi:MAG: hypothetical protein F6J97_23435 [Leptolyngbya sp. SIO4C1]|nr:hypothetical protein [Leptolyngbya sp. SIO4C1]
MSPPLHLTSHTHYYRGGKVTIDPSAAIASGVVLQALPGAAIQIGSSVCLGAGVVIQAKAGRIVIESGASLGTGVLVVGHGKVGTHACIGPASTLINPHVESRAVVPPNSLIGDRSRSEAGTKSAYAESTYAESTYTAHAYTQNGVSGPPMVSMPPRTTPTVSPKPVNIPNVAAGSNAGFNAEANTDSAYGGENRETSGEVNGSATLSVQASSMQASAKVYGRDQVNSLLSALFPHRKPLEPAQFDEDS